jgi:hypothetical protein
MAICEESDWPASAIDGVGPPTRSTTHVTRPQDVDTVRLHSQHRINWTGELRKEDFLAVAPHFGLEGMITMAGRIGATPCCYPALSAAEEPLSADRMTPPLRYACPGTLV